MGKKPAERTVAVATRSTGGFDAAVPCGTCGAPSRASRHPLRRCANGHRFTKKSDQ
jgi:hypothetical protein